MRHYWVKYRLPSGEEPLNWCEANSREEVEALLHKLEPEAKVIYIEAQ